MTLILEPARPHTRTRTPSPSLNDNTSVVDYQRRSGRDAIPGHGREKCVDRSRFLHPTDPSSMARRNTTVRSNTLLS